MQNLFFRCSYLVNVSFSETFDTSQVNNMAEMFSYCQSLSNINVSSFNTSSVLNYYNMFHFNDRLTSLDLSNFEGKYSCDFNRFLFSSFLNLIYVDLSSLYSLYPECNYLTIPRFKNNGIIIANSKLKDICTNNWTIIYKD